MSLYKIFIIIQLFVFLLIEKTNCQQTAQNLQGVLNSIEQEITAKAQVIKQALINKCSTDCSLSYESCIKEDIQMTCQKDFISDECEECNKETPGVILSAISDVKLANKYFPSVDKNDQGVKELTCATQSAASALQGSVNPTMKWQYIATYNGVFRSYPGIKNCAPYDARLRSWYVGASTGAKNLVIIMDVSGSMNTAGKLDIAKEAAKNVVSTLNIFDFVGFVDFSSTAKSFKETLIDANQVNKDDLDGYIDRIVATGGTNFEAGFRKAFEIIDNSAGNELGTGCESVILFLTDGEITEGIENKETLLSLITELNAKHDANIFTYSLGKEADKTVTKYIACNMNGAFENIENSLDLQKAMNSYYLLLSAGINRQNQVIWAEPYQDFFGLGLVTTAAVPIYDDSVSPPFLLGVYGTDLQMKGLQTFESYDKILNAFRNRSMQCTKFNLSNCQMNSFRKVKCDDVSTDCSSVRSGQEQCTNKPGAVFHEAVTGSEVLEKVTLKCCGQQSCGASVGLIVGVVIGILALVAIIIVVICCCKKTKTDDSGNSGYGNNKVQSSQNNNQNQNQNNNREDPHYVNNNNPFNNNNNNHNNSNQNIRQPGHN
jgi:Mg-chelatase subunit ChlD